MPRYPLLTSQTIEQIHQVDFFILFWRRPGHRSRVRGPGLLKVTPIPTRKVLQNPVILTIFDLSGNFVLGISPDPGGQIQVAA